MKPFDPLTLAGTLGTIIDRVGSGDREQLRTELVDGIE